MKITPTAIRLLRSDCGFTATMQMLQPNRHERATADLRVALARFDAAILKLQFRSGSADAVLQAGCRLAQVRRRLRVTPMAVGRDGDAR
jgi:hypothetical protein